MVMRSLQMIRASSAGRSGESSRSLSILSRLSRLARMSSPRASCDVPISAARLAARTSGDAVRKTFTGASGSTTVPMSRPHMTIESLAAIVRCCATSARRTPLTAETADTFASTCGSLRRSVMSSPSSSNLSPAGLATRRMSARFARDDSSHRLSGRTSR